MTRAGTARKGYVVHTLGCKANFADSLEIEAKLQALGYRPRMGRVQKPQVESLEKSHVQSPSSSSENEVGLCVINSCSVTDEADRQSKRLARKLARLHPGARVVMTGCGAEVDPVGMSEVEGVTDVVGNQNKNEFEKLVEEPVSHSKIRGTLTPYAQILSQHPMDRDWPPATLGFREASQEFSMEEGASQWLSKRTRVFLKVQEGCDSFCTYCIIPYGRGPSRSVKSSEIIRQVRSLVAEGVQEVVLTGTNIGEYLDPALGRSHSESLARLVEALLKETAILRIRLSSLDPTQIDRALVGLFRQETRLCPHFHVSLQSPHSKILKMMKRNYKFEEVEACLQRISELPAPLGGVFIGMDVITGFPGETDQEFTWTYQALERLPWSRLHVFPYSERKGTPATRIPGSVPERERKERTRRLSALSFDRLKGHYERVLHQNSSFSINPIQNVLLERGMKSGFVEGYSPNYLRVLIRSENLSPQEVALQSQGKLLLNVLPECLVQDSAQGDVALLGRPVYL